MSGDCRHISHVEAGVELVVFSSYFVMPVITSIGIAKFTSKGAAERGLSEV